MSINKRITVAVDGPAGSGKSSVCRKVASEIDLKYIDSGAIYRAITYYFIDKYGSTDNSVNVTGELSELDIVQNFSKDGSIEVYLNGKDVSSLIRSEEITVNIGYFSDMVEVREFVNSLLRKWSMKESIIMDGRDIGSVVFPAADLKIYLDASVDIRTERRVKDYLEMGKNVDEKSIRKQIIQRDLEDMNRTFGALKRVEDSVYIDSSALTFFEVVETIKEKIKSI